MATASSSYEVKIVRSEFIEQDPNNWWNGLCNACSQLWTQISDSARESCIAVSVCGQMQDITLVNVEKGFLRPAILYSDSRACKQSRQLEESGHLDYIRNTTRNFKGSSSILAKLLWIKENEPECLNMADFIFLGAHDYIVWRLCGATVTDFTTASASGLIDVQEKEWAWGVFELVNLGQYANRLPKLHRFIDGDVGALCSEASASLGLGGDIRCFHAGGDLAAVSMGALGNNLGKSQYIYLGTSGWIASLRCGYEEGKIGDGCFTLLHPDPEYSIRAAAMATAMGNLEWISEVFSDSRLISFGENLGMQMPDKYTMINTLAEKAPVGSGGLLFLPYLCGERSPMNDANARACFVGLSKSTLKSHMYRAVFEGVAFGIRTLKNTLLMRYDDHIVLVGGAANSSVFCQIMANVLNCAVFVPANPQNIGSLGAALVVDLPCKRKKSSSDSPTKKQTAPHLQHLSSSASGFSANVAQKYFPHPETSRVYDQLFTIFSELYPNLKHVFSSLKSFR
eukprot:Sdes_comp20340_c0_seq2m14078